jgi:hypothetical protein|tara:strand:+ start:1292 stop:1789 length:498 start_codon:yes stop_codon:yes gene_type:complete
MNNKADENLDIIIKEAGKMSTVDFRNRISKFQKQIRDYSGSVVRKSYIEDDPFDTVNGANLEHSFGDGTYIRKITMPKDMIYLSAIHLVEHPFFVMSGRCTVISDKGLELLEGPCHGMTKPGTQRILYIHEECVWVTVHPTNKTKVEDVINDVTSKDYNHPKLKI